ncbi:RdgB/HAM1 family non-canonical purine NTP pyrophosphatase [Phototrophicus methaneseepsis]|uniref:dITP/XTP pyrophosphatase n=1 Tax=Phototrophicus methaneseepsis TaxID=2710758 RepID=A0A7S8E9Q2_9CHLR|nr:RdgB/HAM1 family non-canonical purine NTP pyrophosphatase [Phototrophicus methaneseepsis]QPC82971.1 RdgB/HAM1 family non-canonical purine NTP pyrophosphatase [Phototrophicus methaneseepsis]
MRLLVATQNKGKVAEYQRLLADLDWEIVGLGDIGLGSLDVEETGTTFEENAFIKARAYAEASKLITLSDDSGIVVDALNGAPGIYSARYGGPGLDDGGRRRLLLSELEGLPQAERTARFVCVIAVVDPRDGGAEYSAFGKVEGHIMPEERGDNGFGYDPLFMPLGYGRTFGEMPAEEKDPLSHRGVAAAQLPDILRQIT